MSRQAKNAVCVFLFVTIVALLLYTQRLIGLATAAWVGDLKAFSQTDFVNNWFAVKLASQGKLPLIFDFQAYFAELKLEFGDDVDQRAWSYPPHFLLLLLPLGSFELVTAAIVYQLSGFLFFIFSVWALIRQFKPDDVQTPALVLSLSLAPYCLLQLAAMQNGFWFSGLMLLGFAHAGTRPVAAGLCFAMLTTKPQLGILIPFFLMFSGYWRTIVFTIIWTSLLLLATGLTFGFDVLLLYLTGTAPSQAGVLTNWNGVFLYMMPSLIASLRIMGLGSQTAVALYVLWFAILIGPVLWLIWKTSDPLQRVFASVCGTFVLTPYSFSYDMGALCAVAVLLALSEIGRPKASMALALLAALPALILPLSLTHLPFVPLILLSAIVWFILRNAKNTGQLNPPSSASLAGKLA
ncbi:MAG: glycosyltransferase family 87 protein [Pseudomonadota bacterium]